MSTEDDRTPANGRDLDGTASHEPAGATPGEAVLIRHYRVLPPHMQRHLERESTFLVEAARARCGPRPAPRRPPARKRGPQ